MPPASPERKLLAHFVADPGERGELERTLPAQAQRWADALRGQVVQVTAMWGHREDPLRRAGDGAPARAFDGSLEIKLVAPDADAQLLAVVNGIGSLLGPTVDVDLCAVQVGENKVFVAGAPTANRYQYCMRRRRDFDHAAYLARYETAHAQFGIRTQGIEGYTQFHIDLEATTAACAAAGFPDAGFDSVSELHIESMPAFFDAMPHNARLGAGEDEELFVERATSLMWISDEIFRCGF